MTNPMIQHTGADDDCCPHYRGRNLNDSVTVPEIPEAANNGNRLYLRKGEKINLNDLLQGIIIYNANDAAIAAANHLAGSESAFVDEMNAKAQELGMSDTTFASCYGSADDQTSTARDMAILAAQRIQPAEICGAGDPANAGLGQRNEPGHRHQCQRHAECGAQAIGLGLSRGEEINLAASLSQGHRTIVGAMIDAETEDGAYADMQEALNLGLDSTSIVDLISKDEVVTTLNFGEDKSVRIAATADYAITTSQGNSANYRSQAVINQAELPINEGDEVGVLRIYEGDEAIDEVPLVALDSAKAGFNWVWLLVIALIVLYIATFIFISNNVKKRSPRQSGGSVRPAKQAPRRCRRHAPAVRIRADRHHSRNVRSRKSQPAQAVSAKAP